MIKLNRQTYIVSDNHFFHVNIAKYCNRPYKVSELKNKDFLNEEILKMNEDMLKEFDALPEECDIYNNGDLFFVGEENKKKFFAEHYEEMKAIVKRMKGPTGKRKLFIVLGNHDNFHFAGESRIKFYYDLGFNKVYDTPIIIEDNFILSHEPVYISPANNFNNLYGHTHDLDIEESYFCYDYDNYAMITRIAKQEGIEVPPIEIKWPDRKVDLSKYFNVCWDKNHKILDLNKIIKKMK
jgi:calcineurin-like phosphoesterase family protein